MSRSLNQPDDHTLELYKMEYEKCADRYENIYKAIWTNFSYIAITSGAILTFGSTRLDLNHAALIACIPLIFWFWATFMPLDSYGDEANERLKLIENTINQAFNVELGHYTNFFDRRHERQWRLRTRYVVRAFFLLLHLVALLLTFTVYFNTWSRWWVYILPAVIAIIYALYYKVWKLWLWATTLFSILFVVICLNVDAPKRKQETQSININFDGRNWVLSPKETENK
jgi:hypothetical protein